MRDWFESLEAREKLFVSIGVVIVAVSLLYGLIWAPLDKNHVAMASSVDDWHHSLAELRPLKGLAQGGGPATNPRAAAGQQAPIIVVDQTLGSRGLEQYRKRSQPTSPALPSPFWRTRRPTGRRAASGSS